MGRTHAAPLLLSAFLALASLSCGSSLQAGISDNGWCNRIPSSFACTALGSKYPPEKLPSLRVQRSITRGVGRLRRAPNGYPALIIQKKAKGETYTTWMCARLTARTISNRGSGTSKATQKFTRKLGKPGDQAGHIIAGILGFPGNEKWNMAPIAASLNNGKMSGVEGQIRKIVNQKHNRRKGIIVYLRFKYRRNSTRPYEIQVLVFDTRGKKYYWAMKNP